MNLKYPTVGSGLYAYKAADPLSSQTSDGRQHSKLLQLLLKKPWLAYQYRR